MAMPDKRGAVGSGDPPLSLDAPLGDQLDADFLDALNLEAPAMVEVVKRASRYAVAGRGTAGEELLLDKRSLLLGAIETGLAAPTAHSSAAWLARWADGFDPALAATLARLDRGEAVRAAMARGVAFAPSRSVRGLLPRARELASSTFDHTSIHLRHLLFVLLEHPGDEWSFLPTRPSPPDLATLRALIVENVAANPERGERVAGWREALSASPAAAEAARAAIIHRAITADAASPPPADEEAPDDRYRTQADNPAVADLLDRDPFAHVLSERIRSLRHRGRGEDRRRGFMIHIHGRWGSGKSSFLNLLERHLVDERGSGPAVRVIRFNAWTHNSRRPPWWALLSTLYRELLAARHPPLSRRERWALRRLWWLWRLRADVLPLFAIVLLVGLLGIWAVASGSGAVDTAVKLGAGVLTVSAALYAYARTAMFGSQKAAQTYSDLKSDPVGPVARLFERIVDRIEAPLVMFVDDLDRCDSDYLVDLLEGVQNLFKAAPITYVVAADRRWICTAFEKRYADFCRLGEAGRPLGYQFLDKMFQVSAGMPRLTPETQARYLDSLTGPAEATVPLDDAAVERAREACADITDEEELNALVDIAGKGSAEELRVVRAAAALQIVSSPARARTEDRLRALLPLMEENPRSMKRLVNEVAMAQSRGIIEGRRVSPEARARWVILNLRWPLFIDYIADHPQAIDGWRPGEAGGPPARPGAADELPEAVRGLALSKALAATIGRSEDAGALDRGALRTLLA